MKWVLGLFLAFPLLATVVTFTTAGANTWIAPAGVTSVEAECWGGGGAGGQLTASQGAGGAGGGAYAARLTMAVTPGNSYSYTVGSAGATGNPSTDGGTTTFTGDSSVKCQAVGGKGVPQNTLTGGAGGLASASTGDVGHVFTGGAGRTTSDGNGGGGGGSAGSASNGTTATSLTGATAVTGGGPGGDGKNGGNGPGLAPLSGPGGGGGGAKRTSSTQTGGAGWAGQIKLTYTAAVTFVSNPTVIVVGP